MYRDFNQTIFIMWSSDFIVMRWTVVKNWERANIFFAFSYTKWLSRKKWKPHRCTPNLTYWGKHKILDRRCIILCHQSSFESTFYLEETIEIKNLIIIGTTLSSMPILSNDTYATFLSCRWNFACVIIFWFSDSNFRSFSIVFLYA